MQEHKTKYGLMRVGELTTLFEHLIDTFETSAASYGNPFTIGLTGGSTPKAFYNWALQNKTLSEVVLRHAVWGASDERAVPLENEESNFGNADRALLSPLSVPDFRKLPWPVQLDPHSAASVYERRIQERFGQYRAFDLCLLGMGDDGHTASIFPGSPLLAIESSTLFAPVDVPNKGWRLSITPAGLESCGKIVIMVTGKGKADRLKSVMESPEGTYPVQILSKCAEKTEWLVDPEAASLL